MDNNNDMSRYRVVGNSRLERLITPAPPIPAQTTWHQATTGIPIEEYIANHFDRSVPVNQQILIFWNAEKELRAVQRRLENQNGIRAEIKDIFLVVLGSNHLWDNMQDMPVEIARRALFAQRLELQLFLDNEEARLARERSNSSRNF